MGENVVDANMPYGYFSALQHAPSRAFVSKAACAGLAEMLK
jgi:hypothetical protein